MFSRFIKSLIISFFSLLGLLIVLIYTPGLNNRIFSYFVNHYFLPSGYHIKIEHLGGFLPFEIKTSKIFLFNKTDKVLEVDRLRVGLTFTSILKKQIHIDYIKSDRIQLFKPLHSFQDQKNAIDSVNTFKNVISFIHFVKNQSLLTSLDISHILIPFTKDNDFTDFSLRFYKKDGSSYGIFKAYEVNNNSPYAFIRLSPVGENGVMTLFEVKDEFANLSSIPFKFQGNIKIQNLSELNPLGEMYLNLKDLNIKTRFQESQVQKTHICIDINKNNSLLSQVSFLTNLNELALNNKLNFNELLISLPDRLPIQGESFAEFSPQEINLTLNLDSPSDDIQIKSQNKFLIDSQIIQSHGALTKNKESYAYVIKGEILKNEKLADILLQEVNIDHTDYNVQWTSKGFSLNQGGSFQIAYENKKDPLSKLAASGQLTSYKDHKKITLESKNLYDTWGIQKITSMLSFNPFSFKSAIEGEQKGTCEGYFNFKKNKFEVTGNLNLKTQFLTDNMIETQALLKFKMNQEGTGHVEMSSENGHINQPSLLNFSVFKLDLKSHKGEGTFVSSLGKVQKRNYSKPYIHTTGKISFFKKLITLNDFEFIRQNEHIKLSTPLSYQVDKGIINSVLVNLGRRGQISYDPTQKKITFDNVSLLISRIIYDNFDLEGKLKGNILISSLNNWRADIVLSKLHPHPKSKLPRNEMLHKMKWLFKLNKNGNDLHIDTQSLKYENPLFQAKGVIHLNEKLKDSSLNIRTSGILDLGVFSSLSSKGDIIAGEVDNKLSVTGTLKNPLIYGELFVRKGLWESGDFGTYLANIEAQLIAKGNKIEIISCHGTDGRKGKTPGTFTFTGFTQIKDFMLISDVKAIVNDLLVVNQDDMIMRATGFVTLKGAGLQTKFEGEVNLSPSLILLEELTGDNVDEINIDNEVFRVQENDTAKSSNFFPIHLKLVANKNFQINGFGLNSEWKGDIYVQGFLSDPYLVGDLKITKGKLSFFGKTLSMPYASISFDESVPNEPYITVKAEREVDDVIVLMQIVGRASQTKIQFSSSPALPEEEVLSRLLFGREVGRISVGQSIQLAAAGAVISGAKGMNILEGIRSSFGFDTFELKENPSRALTNDSGTTSSQTLSIGKEFKNFKVSIDQNLGSTGSKATVSTALTKNVYLDIELGDKTSGSGAGLSWMKRY